MLPVDPDGSSTMSTSVRNILAATDLSPAAALAVERAARLAWEHGASLELCCAAPLPAPIPVWGDMASAVWIDSAAVAAGVQHQLEELSERLAERFAIRCRCHVETASPGSYLPARAVEAGFDLLVIGATGQGAISRRLLGSTAQTIVRRSLVPVLVVRLAAAESYSRVLATIDFSAAARRAAVLLRALAPSAELSCFTALDLPAFDVDALFGLDAAERERRLELARSRTRSALVDLAAELGPPGTQVLVHDGRASHELAAAIEASGAELISVGSQGKSRLEAGVLGSTSQHAVAEAGCDVLVTPPERA